MKFQKPIVVDLGDNPGKRTFRSTNQIVDWLTSEQRYWSDLHQEYPGQTSLRGPMRKAQIDPINAALNRINERLRQIEESHGPESPFPKDQNSHLETLAFDAYSHGSILHRDSPDGIAVREVAKMDSIAAIGAFALIRKLVPSELRAMDIFAVVKGQKELLRIEYDFEERTTSARRVLDKLVAEFNEELSEQQAHFSTKSLNSSEGSRL